MITPFALIALDGFASSISRLMARAFSTSSFLASFNNNDRNITPDVN